MADWRPILNRRDGGFPRIMGILNITPDSFHADSRIDSVADALARGKRMVEDGAEWLDIGGESTRPGAEPVAPDDEMQRVLPVVEAIRAALPDVGISIDTRRANVARAALAAGADMVNDVSALSDAEMLDVVVEAGCPICLMHMQGLPDDMQNDPAYGDVVAEVRSSLAVSAQALLDAGVGAARIIADPGIGFGTLLAHNTTLPATGREIVPDDRMPMIRAASRKRMCAHLLARDETRPRSADSLAVAALAPAKGVDIIRVHDVREHADLYAAMRAVE